jgi:hypothetical protein
MRFVANDPTVRPPFLEFDLSRHKSLRTLEVLASNIRFKEPGTLTHVLLTITSPAFSEVIFIYRDYDFVSIQSPQLNGIFRGMSPAEHEKDASLRRIGLEVFYEMHKVREFRPVLCADMWDGVRGYAVCELKRVVAAEKVKRGPDEFFSKLSVISTQGTLPLSPEWIYAHTFNPWAPL